jgi:dTDP-4-dehydrorhamnose reductase
MGSRIAGMQLWGGLECTINRVNDEWMDQVERCGHYGRPSDFDRIAELGIKTLRYGLHWERYCRSNSFDIFVEPLAAMQRLGIEPIAGLVHHGSGPADTDLLDPRFPEKLASYARRLAERFPHLRRFTPVNEPQTTARFSALYGHWYPHERSFSAYARALVNQVRATVLAMRAIRAVRPDAELVTTEDGGKVWSTAPLAELCEEREHRRWLGLDLLCGRVDRRHPMFAYLRSNGIAEQEILWFADNPCPPDVIGLNYYLTSDRFLDHQTWNYPDWLAGGDTGAEPLVDVEAVRLRREGIAGAGTILTEAWNRYRLPVAITECHLGGCPEADQVRWLAEVWSQAQQARKHGAEVAAVTVWSLLGSWDWCSLVTCCNGVYEPGVFDVRSGTLAPTPLAAAVRKLGHGETLSVEGKGWWRQPDRFTFTPVTEHDDFEAESLPIEPASLPVCALPPSDARP